MLNSIMIDCVRYGFTRRRVATLANSKINITNGRGMLYVDLPSLSLN